MKRLLVRCLLIAFSVLTTLMCSIHAQLDENAPWPMFQYDARHSSQSPNSGSISGRFLWSYQFEGDYLESSASVGSDGRVYIGTYDNNIYAFTSLGSLTWSFETERNMDSVPAINSDGTLYIGCHDHNLYALTSTGSLSWSYGTSGLARTSPAIGLDGRVYIGSTPNLYVLNSPGSLSWSYNVMDSGLGVYSSPALGTDGRIYIGSDDNSLYSLNSTGSLFWSYRTGGRILSSPAISSDYKIYAGAYDGYIYEFTSACGLSWSYRARPVESSAAVGSDGRVYIGSSSNNFRALNSVGSLLWSYEAGKSFSFCSPAIDSAGRVYVGAYDNNIYGLISDGSLLWSYETGYYVYRSSAIGPDGTVYQASDDRVLYCFRDPTATPTITPTPTATPLPNYINLEASPSEVNPGEVVMLSWSCDFSSWDYERVPVDVYLAAIKDPIVSDAPSSVQDALNGGTVYLFGPGMKDVYVYSGAVGQPTYSNVAFPPVALSNSINIKAPTSPGYAGDYVFATAFLRRDTRGFVRDDGMPVENSNLFTVR